MPAVRRKHAWAMGVPFRAVTAVPLDLFPDTPHCELMVLFERQGDEDDATCAYEGDSDEADDDSLGSDVDDA